MKAFIKSVFLFILFAYTAKSSPAQSLASTYKPKNETEKQIIAKIRALPEVQDFFKNVKKDKPDFIINPPDSTNNCYAMQVGIDYGDIFRTHFWLSIDPKTFQVYYEDFDDEGIETITLQQWRHWRKRPEFDKPHRWVKGELVVVAIKKKKSK